MKNFVLGGLCVLLLGGLSVAVAAPKKVGADDSNKIDYRLVQSHTLYKKGRPRDLENEVRAFLKRTNPKHVVSISHDAGIALVATVMGERKNEGHYRATIYFIPRE